MGVCTRGLRKVWNKDSYGRREYDQGEMCDYGHYKEIEAMSWRPKKEHFFVSITSLILNVFTTWKFKSDYASAHLSNNCLHE